MENKICKCGKQAVGYGTRDERMCDDCLTLLFSTGNRDENLLPLNIAPSHKETLRPCIWKKKVRDGAKLTTTVVETPAYFHEFSQSFIEFESGPGNYPVAIIELEDGTVEVVDADSIKFCENWKP